MHFKLCKASVEYPHLCNAAYNLSLGFDKQTLFNALYPARDKWFEIGRYLDIDEINLAFIRESEQLRDSSMRLNEVIDFWLNMNTSVPKTWISVVDALKSSDVDQIGLAETLENQFLQAEKPNGKYY